MQNTLDAVNTMLLSIGEEAVTDLTEPSAQMAKTTLDFVLNELPYTTNDFPFSYDKLPKEIYNYVVLKATRRFQNQMVGSEVIYQFTAEDELEAKRKIIIKKLVPVDLLTEVETELNEQSDLGSLAPLSLKKNLALLKLQALLFSNPQEYIVSNERVEMELTEFKKKLIVNRQVPLSLVQNVRADYFARYGFSGVIPENILTLDDVTQTLRVLATYEFQKSILKPDEYVITPEDKAQDELDLRMAIVVNRLIPEDLHNKAELEFLRTYGITDAIYITPVMREYILNKALFRLQSILIPNVDQRPIKQEDIDDSEATLLSRLIVPKELYDRVYEEVKVELGIDPTLTDDVIPEAVRVYAKYRSALIHQPTAVRYPSKYIISEKDVIKAKANASGSLPSQSLMDNISVSRLVDRENTPEATSGSTSTKYRLKV